MISQLKKWIQDEGYLLHLMSNKTKEFSIKVHEVETGKAMHTVTPEFRGQLRTQHEKASEKANNKNKRESIQCWLITFCIF